ncbi:MAG: hypothetical protein AAF078_00910 [Planctomycetota bacterium]
MLRRRRRKRRIQRRRVISFALTSTQSPARRLWTRQQGIVGRVGHFVAGVVAIGVGLVAGWLIAAIVGFGVLGPLTQLGQDLLHEAGFGGWVQDLLGVAAFLTGLGCFITIAFVLPLRLVNGIREQQFKSWVRSHLGKGYRGRSGLCFNCGYDLSHGKSLHCPECGTRAASRFIEVA